MIYGFITYAGITTWIWNAHGHENSDHDLNQDEKWQVLPAKKRFDQGRLTKKYPPTATIPMITTAAAMIVVIDLSSSELGFSS